MKRENNFRAIWAVFCLLTLAAMFTSVQAETVTMNLTLSPLNEVPPITNLTAAGSFQLTLEVTRDSTGAITGGKVSVVGFANFPGALVITGLHIHEGSNTVNDSIRFDSGISPGNPVMLATGVGGIALRELSATDAATTITLLTKLRNTPTNFYLNLHTTANPGGAIRSQLIRWDEFHANTITMSPAQEVPPVTGLNATATAAIIVNPTRNASGQVIGGSNVTFNIAYDGFPANTTFTGLHIHEADAGATGNVRFDTEISPTNPLVSPTGKGTINITVSLSVFDRVGPTALGRMLANPAGFYVNLHTTVNPSGAVRGQLTGLSNGAPAITQASAYFLPTSGSNATITVLATGIDLTSTVLVNGQQVLATPDLSTGLISVPVAAALLANPGVLQLQIRSGGGVLSNPLNVVVFAPASVNNINPVMVEAASYGAAVAPESIVAAFGTRLASQIAAPAPGVRVPPVVLDGTSVYVNGVLAPLFFVSSEQINFEIPLGTLPGPTQVIVLAKDGTVSRGQVNVTNTAPAFFTVLATGRGAPAAVGFNPSTQTYFTVSNSDGTPIEFATGNFLILFGTGVRFNSGNVTATAGGVTMTPQFLGAQGDFYGLDQINLQIPATLAGRGELDLVFTIDGKMTNPVRIKIK